MLDECVQPVGELVANQVMDDNIGPRHIHRQQGRPMRQDVPIIDLFDQALGQEGLVEDSR